MKAIVSLTSGVVAIVGTLVGVALFNPPRMADAAVVHGKLVGCPLAEVSVDPGYGVASMALRPVCGAAAR